MGVGVWRCCPSATAEANSDHVTLHPSRVGTAKANEACLRDDPLRSASTTRRCRVCAQSSRTLAAGVELGTMAVMSEELRGVGLGCCPCR